MMHFERGIFGAILLIVESSYTSCGGGGGGSSSGIALASFVEFFFVFNLHFDFRGLCLVSAFFVKYDSDRVIMEMRSVYKLQS